ncbi:helix-turn-helix transcriptional regulator [Gracilibacillus oryzae]|uniref:Helix-turn-helix transcriptional regulator n=1 Tax=Gracilibacillus oryzae TaxID=1672701 RepID=A0A7C8KSH3_9BACI|nr:helix-turn-helix transcriptional regulator [Gracilibacillus oryzae]KAB8139072.1 helix-turn-helix transcriptional regulator [Gracilibacillus oryzae]
MSFNKRLSTLRKKHKHSRDDLASKLGVSYSTIAKYETGSREPDFKTLEKISQIYDVTIDYLLGRTDNPVGEREETINRAFHDFDNITDKEKEYLEEQLRLFRKLNEEE